MILCLGCLNEVLGQTWWLADISLQEQNKLIARKNPPPRSIGMLIKVKPQAKKAKLDPEKPAGCSENAERHDTRIEKPSTKVDEIRPSCLVSYSDESDEED